MNRIRELRELQDWTQEELGQKLNVGKGAVSRYEMEKRQLDPATICLLCDLFDCSADYLLGRSDIRKPEVSEYEIRLIEAFRAADPDLQDLIRRNLKVDLPEQRKAVS